jgi:glycosyltransferase involved in cell wall biosynthesis
MKVTVLCSNLGTNCVMRAALLADLLRDDFEVRLAGIHAGGGLWPPARDLPFPVDAVQVRNALQLGACAWAGDLVRDADAVVVSKPLPTSLLPGWFARRRGIPVVLDIDDWEIGLFPGITGRGVLRALDELTYEAWSAVSPRRLNARLTTRLCDVLARRLSWPKLASNRWLQARYGGDLLYHVRPVTPEMTAPRNGLALDGRSWVGFVGTVRPHKGVETLADALARLEGDAAPGLILAGADPDSSQAQPVIAHAAQVLGPERFRHLPPFPAAELPGVLAACDVISVPSGGGTASRGQIPAKLFDAMAAGRAVVATAVNDIPEILEGCGRVVPPDDVDALAAALAELSTNPALRTKLGDAARRRHAERYSYEAGRPVIVAAVRQALEGGAAAARRAAA